MGNRFVSKPFNWEEKETKFCFITNSEGIIVYSEYFEEKWKEKEPEIQNQLIQLFKKNLKVKKKFQNEN